MTQMTSDQFNNFMFYYYSEMNKFIFQKIQKEAFALEKENGDKNLNKVAPKTESDAGNSEAIEENNVKKVPNEKLKAIVDSVPKELIVHKVLEHLGLRDEKIYEFNIYLQKLSYVFTETNLADDDQVSLIEALE